MGSLSAKNESEKFSRLGTFNEVKKKRNYHKTWIRVRINVRNRIFIRVKEMRTQQHIFTAAATLH
jgi:hypothetical protein